LFVRKNTEIELTNYENLTDVKTMKNYRNVFALVQFCILMAIDDKKMSVCHWQVYSHYLYDLHQCFN